MASTIRPVYQTCSKKSRTETLLNDKFDFLKTTWKLLNHLRAHRSSDNAKRIKNDRDFILEFGSSVEHTYRIITCPIFDGLFGFWSPVSISSEQREMMDISSSTEYFKLQIDERYYSRTQFHVKGREITRPHESAIRRLLPCQAILNLKHERARGERWFTSCKQLNQAKFCIRSSH